MTGVSATLVRIQDRLTQITRRSEEEEAYQARIKALETQNREVLNATKWLREQSTELERALEQRKLELDRAIEARNAAFRKLIRSRKMIRDLLDENKAIYSIKLMATFQPQSQTGFLSGNNVSTLPDERDHQTPAQERAEDFMSAGPEVKDDSDSSTDSHSGDTIRLKQMMGLHTADEDEPQTSSSITLSAHGDESGPSEDIERKIERSPHPVSEKSLSAHPSSPRSSAEQDIWDIQYSRPPSSTELTFGPLKWDTLAARLSLDEKAVRSIVVTFHDC